MRPPTVLGRAPPARLRALEPAAVTAVARDSSRSAPPPRDPSYEALWAMIKRGARDGDLGEFRGRVDEEFGATGLHRADALPFPLEPQWLKPATASAAYPSRSRWRGGRRGGRRRRSN